MDALMEQLVTAGLLELFTDDDGDEAMRLTPEGEKVARQMAMTDDDGQDALIGALLGCYQASSTSMKRSSPELGSVVYGIALSGLLGEPVSACR